MHPNFHADPMGSDPCRPCSVSEYDKGAKRVIGAGRHLTFAELDDELAKWVREQRAGKKKVSRRILKQEALKMFVAEAEEEKNSKLWIVQAWDDLPKEIVEKSFKVCGVTNALDGSEDGIIHCFKKDGPVPSGRAKLCLAREEKEMAMFFQEIDLGEEEENDMSDSDVSIEC
uniref:HTH CENPB-type domain-containing protein n=1 Tax=Ditylenchus dipsaci TaxID=166011 RepID=A0A915EHF0_9BILA